MKKILSTIILSGIFLISSWPQTPEKIYSIAKVDKSHDYYVQQAELWWKEVEKNKKNEEAWYNYYKANRYSCMTYKDLYAFDGHKNDGWEKESPYLKPLEEIIKLIGENIPDTYTDLRLRMEGYPGEEERFSAVEKAYLMRPEDPDLYDELITYYEMKGNIGKRKEFNEKLFRANDISAGFINYNYNVLMTVRPNSIILTFGDNDTYPLWLLQDVLNIRTDVLVFNVSLLSEPAYREAMFGKVGIKSMAKEYKEGATSESKKEIIDYLLKNVNTVQHPVYIGLPAWEQLEGYESNLYLVGLALEYSKENMDNIAVLRDNFENRYALDYLTNRFEYDMSASIVERMNVNYLPGIFKLYEHYMAAGDTYSAGKMKELGLQVAQKVSQEWNEKAKSVLK